MKKWGEIKFNRKWEALKICKEDPNGIIGFPEEESKSNITE